MYTHTHTSVPLRGMVPVYFPTVRSVSEAPPSDSPEPVI